MYFVPLLMGLAAIVWDFWFVKRITHAHEVVVALYEQKMELQQSKLTHLQQQINPMETLLQKLDIIKQQITLLALISN